MKVSKACKKRLRTIKNSGNLTTHISHGGWHVAVYSDSEGNMSVLMSGNGGEFEVAQLASAFYTAFSHLFSPNYDVNFYQVPTSLNIR